MMATAFDGCKEGGEQPSLIVTHPSEWSSYEALLQPEVRFQFTTGAYPKIDGGFNAMMFRGAAVVSDDYCTDGYMYFLNERTWEVCTMNHPKYKTDKMGFTVTDMREPTDQDGTVGYILWYGNLICVNPRMNGVIRTIS